MANTLPAPTEGLVYTNPTTGKRMKYSDGCWKSIDYLPIDGSDSMQGTLWTPDQLINGNTLTGGPDEDTMIDQDNWTAFPAPESDISYYEVAYGNKQFVTVSYSGSKQVAYSGDGINWKSTNSATQNGWTSVYYGDKWVAVSAASSNRAMYSTDGITWTSATNAPLSNWYSVTYGNGRYVAVAFGGPQRVMYSDDGVNWTGVTLSADLQAGEWYGVTYGNGKFLAVGAGGSDRVMYSSDGINWTGVTVSLSAWYSVAYGKGRFVAVAGSGSNQIMYSDDDGVSWTYVAQPANSNWRSIKHYNERFLVVATSGSSLVMYSDNGEDWVTMDAPGGEWMSITYGAGKFVSVAHAGLNRIMAIGYPEIGSTTLFFNGDKVVLDNGEIPSWSRLLSTQSTKLGQTKYYQDSALPTGDSYDYPQGSMWYQPTSNKLNFYNDSDQTWVQL